MSVILRYGLILFSLLVGLAIYLVCRHTSSPFYQWADRLGYSGIVDNARGLISSIHLPAWFIYSLPDGLWMFAFVLFMMAVWDFQLSGPGRVWIIVTVIIGISFEICQALISGMGVFDWTDLFFMTVGALLPILFYTKQSTYEKVF